MSRLLLVDLSSLFRPIWEMRSAEADTDYASKATVARVHELAQGFDGVAVCCDSRKSWRKELCAEYKANRPKQEEPMYHQLALAKEQLAADGFPVWEAEGFEADDVIASACELAIKQLPSGFEAIIASSDKDLCQLVCEQGAYAIRVKSLRTGDVMASTEVKAKFGVDPEDMRDWLCLVGDASDNVPGIKGVGPKTATELLLKHGTLFDLYNKLGDSCTVLGLTPSLFTKLKEGVQAVEMARKLITLRTDVELPFADIFRPRVPKGSLANTLEDDMAIVDGEIIDESTGEILPSREDGLAEAGKQLKAAVASATSGAEPPRPTELKPVKPTGAAALKADKSTSLATVDWSLTLEPQNLSQAVNLAQAVFVSKQFAAYGTPEAVLLAIMTGRDLGISTPAALRSLHIIEGKPTMSAGLMAGLVLRSKTCKQFEIIERTNERATIRIWREGWEKHKDISYSVDDAKRAGRVKQGSGWEKNPADMCVARCQAIGARLGWPDILANVYLPDELGREEAA